MRKQQVIWREEHEKATILPRMANKRPRDGLLRFLEYLRNFNYYPQNGVDIGCGKGRNTIYLAQQGIEVHAIDYIDIAINYTQEWAKHLGLSKKVHTYLSAIDSKWLFNDEFFDIAIDCFASIDIETKEGREIYREEMYRTLKPGGYALVTVVSAEDEIEAELTRTSPGEEKNSTIWPKNGKFQKNYDEEELRDFYRIFDILEVKERKQPAFKLGKHFTATDFWLLLRKPQ